MRSVRSVREIERGIAGRRFRQPARVVAAGTEGSAFGKTALGAAGHGRRIDLGSSGEGIDRATRRAPVHGGIHRLDVRQSEGGWRSVQPECRNLRAEMLRCAHRPTPTAGTLPRAKVVTACVRTSSATSCDGAELFGTVPTPARTPYAARHPNARFHPSATFRPRRMWNTRSPLFAAPTSQTTTASRALPIHASGDSLKPTRDIQVAHRRRCAATDGPDPAERPRSCRQRETRAEFRQATRRHQRIQRTTARSNSACAGCAPSRRAARSHLWERRDRDAWLGRVNSASSQSDGFDSRPNPP